MKTLLYSFLFIFAFTKSFSQPNLLWQKTLGGSDRESAYSIVSTKDGGSVVCIEASSDDGDVTKTGTYADYWIVKLNSDGDIEWQKSFEGNGSDRPTSIVEANDGGYVIAGGTLIVENGIVNNSGNWDAWIIKLTSQGILEWEKKYGGMFQDGAIGMTKTFNRGFCFVGVNTVNEATEYDAWIVRMSPIGTQSWSKIIKGDKDDRFFNVTETRDSGLICVGQSSSTSGEFGAGLGDDDGLITKFDKDGTLLWYKRYGGNKTDILRDVIELENGNIIAIGYSESFGDQVSPPLNTPCLWAIVVNKEGEIIWEKIYPGDFGTNFGYSIKKINNNSFVIAGGGYKNDLDFRLLKIDTSGTVNWDTYFGGSEEDMAISVDISQNNTLIMAGYTFSEDGNVTNNKGATDAWVIKLQMNDSLISSVYQQFSQPLIIPNPVSLECKLSIEVEKEDTYTIQLLSIDGALYRSLFQGTLDKGTKSFTIDSKDIPSGAFFCVVKNSLDVQTQKVLIVK